MSGNSKIEWTEKTWNPVTGCSKVSQGCKHCYAERVFQRIYPGRAFTDIQCHEDRLNAPLHWRTPARIFVNSMSDLFHESVPDAFITQVFAVMALCPQHTFQILTKRPARMLAYMSINKLFERVDQAVVANLKRRDLRNWMPANWPLRNVWLGVSIEDQKTADERIPLLQATPAAVRWISYEPALGAVDVRPFLPQIEDNTDAEDGEGVKHCLACHYTFDGDHLCSQALNWVVCGGESGPKARPMHPDWARSMRDQCQAARVPFFFKQWGEWGLGYAPPSGTPGRYSIVSDAASTEVNEYPCSFTSFGSALMERLGKKAAGRTLDGFEWSEYPERAS